MDNQQVVQAAIFCSKTGEQVGETKSMSAWELHEKNRELVLCGYHKAIYWARVESGNQEIPLKTPA